MSSPSKATLRESELPALRDARPRGGLREVGVLAYPVILTQVSITTMHVVDSAMVGRLGATELGAVGFGGIWTWTAMCFFVGATTAVQTFVAQHHGAGEEERCGAWTWQGFYAALPLTALGCVALLLGAGALVHQVGPSPELEPLATGYIRARSLGGVGLVAAVSISSFFRGTGDTRTPLYTTVFANVVNVVLDYGLIFGELGMPRLGVVGAGIATSIAEWIYLAGGLWFFSRSKVAQEFATGWVAPSRDAIRRLLRTGLPIGGQWWLEMASFAAFSALVVRMGDASMAASQAFIVLLSISFMQAIGLGIAVSTLVGRYIGARDPASVERSFRSGLALSGVLAGVIALLFVAIPEALLGIFSSDPQVLALGRPLLLMGAAFQVFDAVAIVADGALRGAGDTRWPMVVRFGLSWGLFLPLAYLVGITLEGGLLGAWSAGIVQVALLAAVLVVRFRSGAWRRIQI